jgi:hypothetical protein
LPAPARALARRRVGERLEQLPVSLGSLAVAEHVRRPGGAAQGIDVRGLAAEDGDEVLERSRFAAGVEQERRQVKAQRDGGWVFLKRLAERFQESRVSRQTS